MFVAALHFFAGRVCTREARSFAHRANQPHGLALRRPRRQGNRSAVRRRIDSEWIIVVIFARRWCRLAGSRFCCRSRSRGSTRRAWSLFGDRLRRGLRCEGFPASLASFHVRAAERTVLDIVIQDRLLTRGTGRKHGNSISFYRGDWSRRPQNTTSSRKCLANAGARMPSSEFDSVCDEWTDSGASKFPKECARSATFQLPSRFVQGRDLLGRRHSRIVLRTARGECVGRHFCEGHSEPSLVDAATGP